ncbi:hypothetical protein K503DRAFT_776543 [Rhizopogon vinicolor AM-OR11-026]|uniref:F-box domain-containing protein n=1 Tax=Rhizopogon vinicolor AM-OR11-026 TaxID=1314800 RepID=A0A1B7MIZ3_9AGAM|nr:hypothetical protein K503DRAFT_776543 [Rhizopogon vinicolor AM-OR11-026]
MYSCSALTTSQTSIFLCGEKSISANFANPPLLFTQVCHLWRFIAHSTPGIWSSIQVAFPGCAEPLKPFLPSLLHFWLTCSGSQPLTLRILSKRIPYPVRVGCREVLCRDKFSEADSQLFEILHSESKRWETVAVMSHLHENWSHNIDTPKLRSLEYPYVEDLGRFDAPNLSRLHIGPMCRFNGPLPTRNLNNIGHLYLQEGSSTIIHTSLAIFPRLESIVVQRIIPDDRTGTSVTRSCLESMILPLPDPNHRDRFIQIFDGFYVPMLQKLTLMETPTMLHVDCIAAALAVTSCNVQRVHFQVTTPSSDWEVDMHTIVDQLLSVVGEVEVICCPVPCK